MASFNSVTLVGNVVREIELRFTQSGTAVAEIDLAVNRKFRKKDGSSDEEVLFISVTVWGNTAENCSKYVTKGSPVLVSGYLSMDSWQDKDSGQNRSKIKVTATVVQFLSGKGEGGSQGGSQQPTGQQPQRQQPAPAPRPSTSGRTTRGGTDDLDLGEIPF